MCKIGASAAVGVDMSGEIGNTLVSLAQAAQIFALENVSNELALLLNRYENHTDTEFTAALTESLSFKELIPSFRIFISRSSSSCKRIGPYSQPFPSARL